MKTSELTGAQLDYWVAKAEGFPIETLGGNGAPTWYKARGRYIGGVSSDIPDPDLDYSPSVAWHDGGPIIEREAIALEKIGPSLWAATIETSEGKEIAYEHGEAALVAAMRAYVASKFGETLDFSIP